MSQQVSIVDESATLISGAFYRSIMGNVPTSVAVVTAASETGVPSGLTVGTFTAVSLDPPLVAFFPDKSSSSYPAIRAAGKFCANILAADQGSVCQSFALKGSEKFANVQWRPSGLGNPVIADCVAWVDCVIEQEIELGDHYLVIGRVIEMAGELSAPPLVFLRGGYGEFASSRKSMASDDGR